MSLITILEIVNNNLTGLWCSLYLDDILSCARGLWSLLSSRSTDTKCAFAYIQSATNSHTRHYSNGTRIANKSASTGALNCLYRNERHRWEVLVLIRKELELNHDLFWRMRQLFNYAKFKEEKNVHTITSYSAWKVFIFLNFFRALKHGDNLA